MNKNEVSDFISAQKISGFFLFLSQLSSIFLIPLITKNYSQELLAEFILITGSISLFVSFVTGGIGYTYMKEYSNSSNKAKKGFLFYSQFFMSLAIIIIASIITYGIGFFASIVNQNFLWVVEFSVLLAFLLSTLFISKLLEFYRFEKESLIYSVYNFIYSFFPFIAILLYFTLGEKINIESMLIVISCLNFILILIVSRQVLTRIPVVFSFPTTRIIKNDIKYGIKWKFSNLLEAFFQYIDKLIIGVFLSTGTLGAYVVSITVGSAMILLPKIVNIFLLPFVLVDRDVNESNDLKITTISSNLFLLFAIPYIFGVFVIGEDVIELFSTHEIAIEAGYLAYLFSIGAIFYGLYINIKPIFIKNNQTHDLFSSRIFSLFVLIVMLILGIYYESLLVISIGVVISNIVGYVYLLNKTKNVTLDFTCIKKYMISSFVMLIALVFFKSVFQLHDIDFTVFYLLLIGLLTYFTSLVILNNGWNGKIVGLLVRSD
ncbi:oligosaccharide flippase family protein [bacterium]|jgi:O-antigen/teichoic acid export membrane protein|nr:oligosaccharide flippase family protein [bacterium]